jgi:Asp/Glu/hydantoin racemase
MGPAVDCARRVVQVPLLKIDDAHTTKAVRDARRIGVLATAATTLRPTVALIQEKAAALSKTVEIRELLAASAFETLMRGDSPRHDALVLDAVRQLAPHVDLILFAQASMARLEAAAREAAQIPVLTSPRLALEYTRSVLDGRPADSLAFQAEPLSQFTHGANHP